MVKSRLPGARELYTDYVITCGGQSFPVHRLILHIHSPVFAASFTNGWLESQGNSIREVGDPISKAADTATAGTVSGSSEGPEVSTASVLDIDVALFEPDAIQAMLDYFYTATYHVPGDTGPLLFHLRVYTVAECYDAESLMHASRRALEKECIGDNWDTLDFVEGVRFLHDRLVIKDSRRLMEVLMTTMRRCLSTLIRCDEFKTMLSELPDVNERLLMLLHGDGTIGERSQARRQQEDSGAGPSTAGHGGGGRGRGRGGRGSW